MANGIKSQGQAGKRANKLSSPSAMTSTILRQCGNKPASLSSACNCYLGTSSSVVPTTTTTIVSNTITSIVSMLDIGSSFSSSYNKMTNIKISLSFCFSSQITSTSTQFVSVVATSTCNPFRAPVILNAGFDDSSANINPWTVVNNFGDDYTGSYIIDTDSDNADSPSNSLVVTLNEPGGSDPGSNYRVVYFDQDLTTCPGLTYTLSFRYKFEIIDGDHDPHGSYIVAFVDDKDFIHVNGQDDTQWYTATGQFTATQATSHFEIRLLDAGGFYTNNVIRIDTFSVQFEV